MCPSVQRGPWIYALVAIALVSGGVAAAEPLRVVVQVAGTGDDELVRRIRGQSVDLDVSVLPVEGPAPSPRLAVQFESARALASGHGARVVIWFCPLESGGLTLYIADPGRDAVFVRQIRESGRESGAHSATAETIALVVRSALRVLVAGGDIGVPRAEAIRDEAPRELVGEPVRAPTTEPWTWHAGIGWQLVADGARPAGRHGVTAQVAIGRRRWYALAALSTGPALTDRDELTAIRVGRHALGLAVGAAIWRVSRAVVSVELGIGALVYTRSTEAFSPEVVPAPPSRTPALALGPAVRYRRALGWRGVAIELFAGGDVVLGAPEFGYDIAGQFVRRSSVWPVQLRLGASLVVQAR